MGKDFLSHVKVRRLIEFNSDECRFPHVLPDAPAPSHLPHFAPRGGHRPRPSFHAANVNAIEENLSTMTVQDVS